jgi:hypothetical protein
MKTFLCFVFTCLVSTGALLGALNAKNPFPAFAVAFCIWAVFIWGYNRREKKRAEKDRAERMFRDYMRMQYRKPNR